MNEILGKVIVNDYVRFILSPLYAFKKVLVLSLIMLHRIQNSQFKRICKRQYFFQF